MTLLLIVIIRLEMREVVLLLIRIVGHKGAFMRPFFAAYACEGAEFEKEKGEGGGEREGKKRRGRRRERWEVFTPCGAGPSHQGGGDPGLGRPASRRGRCRWAAPRTGTVHGTIRREERPRCQSSIFSLGLREAPVPGAASQLRRHPPNTCLPAEPLACWRPCEVGSNP